MRKNRTEIGIMLEILTCLEGENETTGDILKKVNVPYTRLITYIGVLKEKKLIEEIDGTNSYKITKEGLTFISETKKFTKLLDIYGLRF
ncbi:MAG: winged helix-turn-helix domain-containing protein [Thermoplasmata archaeon]